MRNLIINFNLCKSDFKKHLKNDDLFTAIIRIYKDLAPDKSKKKYIKFTLK